MKKLLWGAIFGILTVVAHADAIETIPTELTSKVGRCKKPAAARPELPAEKGPDGREAARSGWYSAVVVDFNGDGWCDFAWAVPYPVNSRMESYFLSDILILGGHRHWRQIQSSKLDRDTNVWPDFRIDLTEIALVRSQAGGAPFVLGLRDPHDFGKTWFPSGCRQQSTVHQWDETMDTFKRIDGAQREAVLNFYYRHVETPCRR